LLFKREWQRHQLGRPRTPYLCSGEVTSLIIAIDGPAASGKSTTAKRVAERFGYTYIDSGAMYRAVALQAICAGVPLEDEEGLTRVAEVAEIVLEDLGRGRITLDAEDVTEAIRAPEVTAAASVMSTVPGVRKALVLQQRQLGRNGSCVMEGRDIGTVVFPDADLRVFLVASLEVRAGRRLHDLASRGVDATLEDVMEEIAERDRRDSTRTDSPLRRAADAIEVDTTELSIDEQVEEVVRLALERGAEVTGRSEA
jgi:cytidylate kinase